MANKLAINGGTSLAHYQDWPRWPIYNSLIANSLEEVLLSSRWTISGFYDGKTTFDKKFCNAFAEYNNTQYVLTLDHGSSAIIIALQALGVSFGDEVILPGLTWVACASAILRVNARPVFVDIEEATLCLDPIRVEEAITSRTRAILVVHLYACMANMDHLKRISKKYCIPLIEDCSQAHGAIWGNKKAGSIGDIGVFSMQQGKLLTCGEGGAVITDDKFLFERMFMLQNDGRSYQANVPLGYQELKEENNVIGSNFALSEFQCAILLENLRTLDDILTKQRDNYSILYDMLKVIPGLDLLRPHYQNMPQTCYHFVVLYDASAFANIPLHVICKALSKELGIWVHPIYQPLYRHNLFQVNNDPRFKYLGLPDYNHLNLKTVEKQSSRGIAFHHSILLASPFLLEKIVAAFKKIQRYSSELV